MDEGNISSFFLRKMRFSTVQFSLPSTHHADRLIVWTENEDKAWATTSTVDRVDPNDGDHDVIADEGCTTGANAGEAENLFELPVESHETNLLVLTTGQPKKGLLGIASIETNTMHGSVTLFGIFRFSVEIQKLTCGVVMREETRSVAIRDVNVVIGRIDLDLRGGILGFRVFVRTRIRAPNFQYCFPLKGHFSNERIFPIGVGHPEEFGISLFAERQSVSPFDSLKEGSLKFSVGTVD